MNTGKPHIIHQKMLLPTNFLIRILSCFISCRSGSARHSAPPSCRPALDNVMKPQKGITLDRPIGTNQSHSKSGNMKIKKSET